MSIKEAIITRALEKRKSQKPFDIEASDRFVIPEGSPWQENNSQYFCLQDGPSTPSTQVASQLSSGAGKRRSLYFRLAGRGGDAATEVWLCYRDGDGPVYMSKNDLVPKNEALPAVIECVEAGKTLKFSWHGPVVAAKKTEKGYEPDENAPILQADMDAVFSATSPAFDFTYNGSSRSIARAIAKGKMTKDTQKSLAAGAQTHFEQGGTADAGLKISGEGVSIEETFSKTPCIRDHSYGRRDWEEMLRHIWLLAILDNGDFVSTSLVYYPGLAGLEAGFYTKAGGATVPVDRIAWENGKVPGDGGEPKAVKYTVFYTDGSKADISCRLDFAPAYDFQKGGYQLWVGLGDFTVNGVKGRGIMEFAYNGKMKF
jgi:hypothetical protein